MKFTIVFALILSIYAGVPGGYRLVWSDEFNGNSIDTGKWGFDIGGGGWGNNELQYYTNRWENAYVADGLLHIRARRESYGGRDYTSARMLTKGKFDFQYGYIEGRIRLPRGSGIWPAFWMLGSNIDSVGWPSCGEIDILETVNAENKVYSTCHWSSNGGHAEYGRDSGYVDVTQFHTYAVYWDRDYIRSYIDGREYYAIYISNGTGNTWPLHNRAFIILNVAVGGNWPGWNIDNNQFPTEMQVDYVRVYQP